MNNTEDTKNGIVMDNESKSPNGTQGLTKTERHLRQRANKVNYNILDHGDSATPSDEEDYIEPKDEGKKKKGKKSGRTASSNNIPFITKKSQKLSSIDEFAIKIEEDTIEDKSDEIDKLVTDLKTKPKVRRAVVESQNEPIDQVIDLSELATGIVTNSKLLLALIEICVNAKNYGITLQNKSRIFWDEVYSKKEFENILKNFKAETLRKYWRIISDIGDLKGVINTIKKFEDVINQENAK